MSGGNFPRLPLSPGPVPTVDPADLKRVWDLTTEICTSLPGQQVSIDWELYEKACSPGANVVAVWYRVSMLGLLRSISQFTGQFQLKPPALVFLPEIDYAHPGDAVFRVLAVIPMEVVAIGTPQQGFPFDLQEFARLIGEEDTRST